VSTHCLLGFLECAASYITSSLTDWFFFLVLDIGTPAIEAIPLHRRVLLGLLQAVAVRAAGFAAVPLAALAPGVT
jgi:Trk-type K+ transport system membrane component